jgi:hypothetical protein
VPRQERMKRRRFPRRLAMAMTESSTRESVPFRRATLQLVRDQPDQIDG